VSRRHRQDDIGRLDEFGQKLAGAMGGQIEAALFHRRLRVNRRGILAICRQPCRQHQNLFVEAAGPDLALSIASAIGCGRYSLCIRAELVS
jgi:hypothetical protein